MRVMRDFECQNSHKTEHFVDSTTEEVKCPVCGETAVKQVSAARSKLEPYSGAFPGAYHSWNRMRLEKLKHEKKQSQAAAGE